jgi:hypothetical protein
MAPTVSPSTAGIALMILLLLLWLQMRRQVARCRLCMLLALLHQQVIL